jgi:hypothetical protein
MATQKSLINGSQIVLANSTRNVEAIKVITKLPNSEQSYKGKVQTHNYINRQNQSTTGKLVEFARTICEPLINGKWDTIALASLTYFLL